MISGGAWGWAHNLGAFANDVESARVLKVKVVIKIDSGDCG